MTGRTRRRTPGRVALAAVVLLLALQACGENDVESYCSEVKQQRKELADMVETGSPAALLGALPTLRDLAEAAPPDLEDEWQTFLPAVEALEEALDDAGVEPGDFEDGKPPSGLSSGDQQAIKEAADRIRADDVVRAAAGIEQQARDVCKVNFGL